MNIVQVIALAKKDDPSLGLHVLVDDAGWWHIAKLPPSRDNIFFCIEEIEILTGVELFVKSVRPVSELNDLEKKALEKWTNLY